MNCAFQTTGLTALLALSLSFAASCGSDPANREVPATGIQTVENAGSSADGDSSGGSISAGAPAAADGGSISAGSPSDATDDSTASDANTASDADTATDADAVAPPAKDRFIPGGSVSDADLGNYYVSMTCTVDGEDVGTMTFDMWTESAPITTRNFLRLCDEGFYDGIVFHRILRDFMVQGGDPTGTGAGNSPHGTIKAEFSRDANRNHSYGVLSMARLGGQPDTASCQFFLCCSDSPSVRSLNGQYASFGKLTGGVKTLEALANVPVRVKRGERSAPTKRAIITKATVIEGEAPTSESIRRP